MVSANLRPGRAGLKTALGRLGWLLGGQAGYALSQWGLLVAMARWGTAADLGAFALALALTAPLFMLANLQLRAVYLADTSGRPFGDYLLARLLTTSGAWVLVILGAAIASRWHPDTAWTVGWVGTAKAAEAISEILYGYQQRLGRNQRVAASLLMRGIGGVFILAAGLALTVPFRTALLGWAGWWILCLGYDGFPLVQSRFRFREASVRGLIRRAPPLGIFSLLSSLTTSLPRYYLSHTLGLTELGVFAAFTYLKVAVGYGVEAAGSLLLSELGQRFRTNSGYFQLMNRLLLGGFLLGLLLILLMAAVGETMVSALYTPAYGGRPELLLATAVSCALSIINRLLAFGWVATGRFRVSAGLGLLEFFLLNGLILFGVRYGLEGVAWAQVAAEVGRMALGLQLFFGKTNQSPVPLSAPPRV